MQAGLSDRNRCQRRLRSERVYRTGRDWSVQAPAGSYVIYADAMTGTALVQPGNLYLTAAVKVTTNFSSDHARRLQFADSG